VAYRAVAEGHRGALKGYKLATFSHVVSSATTLKRAPLDMERPDPYDASVVTGARRPILCCPWSPVSLFSTPSVHSKHTAPASHRKENSAGTSQQNA